MNPQARALAKQKSQSRLHRLVRSIFARSVWEWWLLHKPQAVGQLSGAAEAFWGFAMPFPTVLYLLKRWYIPASDQYRFLKKPCSGQVRVIQIFCSSSAISASTTVLQTGQRLRVFFISIDVHP